MVARTIRVSGAITAKPSVSGGSRRWWRADSRAVPLVQERLPRERRAGDTLDDPSGRRGTREVARQDPRDALPRETACQSLGLRDTARRKRAVGKLHGARGVADRLAVPDQKDHRRSA